MPAIFLQLIFSVPMNQAATNTNTGEVIIKTEELTRLVYDTPHKKKVWFKVTPSKAQIPTKIQSSRPLIFSLEKKGLQANKTRETEKHRMANKAKLSTWASKMGLMVK